MVHISWVSLSTAKWRIPEVLPCSIDPLCTLKFSPTFDVCGRSPSPLRCWPTEPTCNGQSYLPFPPKAYSDHHSITVGVSTQGEEKEGCCLSLTGPPLRELQDLGRQKGKT